MKSLLRQCLQYIIVEHDLVQQVPIPNKLCPKYLQNGGLITTIIYCIICPQIFACPDTSLTNMF